jgi:hypothetical protein
MGPSLSDEIRQEKMYVLLYVWDFETQPRLTFKKRASYM